MRITLVFIIVVALIFRALYLLHGFSFHPDERHMVMVTMRLGLDNLNPESFAYGSFPFYLLWLISSALGVLSPWLASYDGLFLVGRSLTALFGVIGVYLVYQLAFIIIRDRTAALMSAVLLGTNILHIQLSRFFTVDIILTTLCTAALIGIIRLYETRLTSWYILSGLLIGLAVATKISALSLLLPVAAAVFLTHVTERKWLVPRSFTSLLLLLVTALFTVALVQPYMFLDWPTFLAQTREQMNMVRGDWRPPYTIQYENTARYLYHLEQMFLFTVSPPVLLAAGIGFILFLKRQLKSLRAADLILLSWLIPYFMVVAGYQVKFPRYLLPLYPLISLFAAYFLIRIARSIPGTVVGYIPAFILTIWSILYSLAFVNIYTAEHSYKSSSEWVFENIPSNAVLLGVHWDDKLPLHLPGLDPRRYNMFGEEFELRLYEPESKERIDNISRQLSTGDYIIFPTARLYGSLMRVPDEFPLTNNFFKLLFAEKLGYRLERTFKTYPSLFSLKFNNDLADESLTVYDHPKVLIFKNVDRLNSHTILERITHPEPFSPLPDRESIMTMKSSLPSYSGTPTADTVKRQWELPAVLAWPFCLLLLAGGTSLWLFRLFPFKPEYTVALSFPIGFFSFGFVVWFLASTTGISQTRMLIWGIFFCLVLLPFFLQRSSDRLNELLSCGWFPLILFLASFVFALSLRSFNPEIYWGEKPMNFSFLNFFVRLENLPPDDPWAAGQRMNYYYLGSYFFGLLHRLTGISPAFGYNLSIATIFSLLMVSSYALFLWVTNNRKWSIAGALIVVLASNIEVLYLVFFSERKIDFHLFWASTRLFTSPAITEYPFWSFLFGDLHAHVISSPIVMTALALLPGLMSKNTERLTKANVCFLVIYSVLLAVSFGVNAWDAISLSFITGIAFLFAALTAIGSGNAPLQLLSILRNGIIISLFSFLFISPFLLQSTATGALRYGVVSEGFDTAWQFFRHLGHWLGIIAVASLLFLGRCKISSVQTKHIILVLLLGIFPLALGFLIYGTGAATVPSGILITSSVLMICGAVIMANALDDKLKIAAIMIVAAGSLIALTQVFFLMDRMNTIFKFYNVVWLLLGVSSIALLHHFRNTKWSRLFFSPALLLLLIAAMGSVVNMAIMTTHRHVQGPRPTLDGTAYLRVTQPEEAELIEWINANIAGTPVTAEAHGPGYGPYTRITMHTGLPTVLGWDHHVSQRGTSHEEIRRRREGLESLYGPGNADEIRKFLNRYKVEYIVVGELERRTYGEEHLDKFYESEDLFQVVFENQGVALFKVLHQ